ncbi:SAF_CpaB_FlgA_like domain containing protein [Candidatus Nanopelagicaceae bacterium]
MIVEKSPSTFQGELASATMPITSKKKSQSRLVIASTLFFASVFASFLISYISNQSDSYWVALHPIAKGVQISPSDVTLAKGSLTSTMKGYIESKSNPIGSITRRTFNAGELIHSTALSENIEDLTTESISIAVRSSDLPTSIASGDIVALYQVHDARNGETVPEPIRIVSGVFIKEIAKQGSNFGGDAALTISLNRDDIPQVLTATSSGRIVVVAIRG